MHFESQGGRDPDRALACGIMSQHDCFTKTFKFLQKRHVNRSMMVISIEKLLTEFIDIVAYGVIICFMP